MNYLHVSEKMYEWLISSAFYKKVKAMSLMVSGTVTGVGEDGSISFNNSAYALV